jgi:hypothetical protein
VKSEGNFEDILAADRPDVWESHRPAAGGEAGAMLAKIIERAAALKAGRASAAKPPRPGRTTVKPAARARTKKKPAAGAGTAASPTRKRRPSAKKTSA